MMIRHWCFCVFPVLIDKVCLQVTGVFGGSVIIPCLTQRDFELQDTDVIWRHNNGKIVHDIIKGNQVKTQDLLYKNRTESFPEEYLKGNFSIKLNNLQDTDAGKYICYITNSSDSRQETVQLIIKESTAEKGNKTNDQENQNQAESVPNVVTSLPFQWVFIVFVLLLLIVLIASFIFFYLRKRAQALLFSPAMTEEQITMT